MFSRIFSRGNKTRLPRGVRIYAVGDIHGRADLLQRLTRRIDEHRASRPIARTIEVYLGDYIDRGPSSRAVVDHLIGRSLNHKSVFLKGNHEAFLMEFIKHPGMLEIWREIGGLQTLTSYGISYGIGTPIETAAKTLSVALKAAMPQSHQAFFKKLKSSFSYGEYFFVHAGVRPGVALAKQSETDLLWIRDEFLAHDDDFGKIVVHGHTPVNEPDLRSNRINIDTGAYATERLTCVTLEKNEVAFI
jgi:serine/threonine protein phosphatase 1